MKILLLLGAPSVGKMTVGQHIASQTGLTLVHNHITIEPVYATLGYIDWEMVEDIRKVFYADLLKSGRSGFIFTFAVDFNSEVDKACLKSYCDRFAGHELACVELIAKRETRIQRAGTHNRLVHKPSQRDYFEVRRRILSEAEKNSRYLSKVSELPVIDSVVVDTERMSAADAADLIVHSLKMFKDLPQ